MKYQKRLISVALVALLATLLTAHLNAQTGEAPADDSKSKSQVDVVPKAALLTERGRQLAEELRLLKRTRESLGSRHPTLPLINQKIEAINEQLQAWEPAANPFHPNEAKDKPQINEYDLRQIVIQLSKRVEVLEKRVAELEKR